MAEERDIVEAIRAVSDAVAGEESWATSGLALRQLTRAGSYSLWVGDPLAGQVEILGTSFNESVENRYKAHYHAVDLWSLRAAQLASPSPVFGTELVPDTELRRSEILTDFYHPIGIHHLLAAGMPLGGTAGFMALGFHRPEPSVAFEEIDRRSLVVVLPHLLRGLRMRHELRVVTGAASAAMAGIAAFSTAALVVTPQGRIVMANDLADALLQAGRGISSRASMLRLSDPHDEASLRRLLGGIARGQMGGLIRLRPTRGHAAIVLMVARTASPHGGALGLVLLIDPGSRRRRGCVTLLGAVFGLTAAEAEVAAAAADGADASSIAAERGTTVTTVRAQLRRVLEKTGADTLRSLTARIASLPDPP